MANNVSGKQMFIKARYFLKEKHSVCCAVQSGDHEYHTWIHQDGTTSCDCPATVKACKHVRMVVQSEIKRVRTGRQAFSKHVLCGIVDPTPIPAANVERDLATKGTLGGALHAASFFANLPSRQPPKAKAS